MWRSTLVPVAILSIAVLYGPPGRTGPLSTLPSSKDSLLNRTDFDDYVWPTDAGSIITSTFAEYRKTHFHGGIDISTGNRTGFRVFASRDGYVARARINANGYGKMLYVRHADGFYTTYAHLRDFNTAIEGRVRHEQMERGSYIADLTFEPGELTVRKGEVIAYTGDTGVGSPHLHFEIRDPHLDFVNPMLARNFSNSDRVPPSVRMIAIRPVGPESLVDGSWTVQVRPVDQKKQGVYHVNKPVRITGGAGLEIDARDQADGTYFRQGIHSHELFVDDQLHYAVRLDRAPSGKSHQSGLYYDWELFDRGKGRFHKLYIDSPNDLHIYNPREDSAGVLRVPGLPEGEHTFRIVSTDRGGNTVEVSGVFFLHRPPVFEVMPAPGSFRTTFFDPAGTRKALISLRKGGARKWITESRGLDPQTTSFEFSAEGFDIAKIEAVDAWGSTSLPRFHFLQKPAGTNGSLTVEHETTGRFVRLQIRGDGPLTSLPEITLYEGPDRRRVRAHALAMDHYFATFVPDESFGGLRRVVVQAEVNGDAVSAFDEFEIYPLREGASGTYIIDGGRLIVSYDSSSVLGTTFVEVLKSDLGNERTYILEPSRTVLDDGIVVAVRSALPGGVRKGLFAHSRRGWEFLGGGDGVPGGLISGRLTQTLGEVGVIADTVAPVISRLKVEERRKGRVSVTFRYGDNFAGIEYQELKMYIDGDVVIPEIDGEHRRVSYHATDPLARGSHLLTIHIRDKLGNHSEVTKEFNTR
jgi:hypothetical protein